MFTPTDEREMEQKVVAFAWDRIYKTLSNHNTSQKRKDSLSEKIVLKCLGRVQIDNRNQISNAEQIISKLDTNELERIVRLGIQGVLQTEPARIGQVGEIDDKDEGGRNLSACAESCANDVDQPSREMSA